MGVVQLCSQMIAFWAGEFPSVLLGKRGYISYGKAYWISLPARQYSNRSLWQVTACPWIIWLVFHKRKLGFGLPLPLVNTKSPMQNFWVCLWEKCSSYSRNQCFLYDFCYSGWASPFESQVDFSFQTPLNISLLPHTSALHSWRLGNCSRKGEIAKTEAPSFHLVQAP